MTSILENEQAAARLRHHLTMAQLPELKLLCGLRFIERFGDEDVSRIESYIREFIPALAEAAAKSNPQEFLPEESDSLAQLVILLEKTDPDTVSPDDLDRFKKLSDALSIGILYSESRDRTDVTCLICLFVEYNPDLDLPPRGRLLNLEVRAGKLSARAEEDDIVIRNPVSEPDDRFISQARDSVAAAREYLHHKYGLSPGKRYRFDFSIDSTGARFTGDSLGVAFAVGAIAAVEKVGIFRERLSVSTDAAFSGALSPDGKLEPVDEEALKLKIYRAFHSNLRYLVIPREHITAAWQYLSELEKKRPNHLPEREHPVRSLELVGADMLDAVAADPRLVPAQKSSASAYVARKVWQAKRSTWVEVPALLVLLAVLFVLIAPARWMPWFDDNPAYTFANITDNRLDVYNHDSILLWSNIYKCDFAELMSYNPTKFGKIGDLNDDGRNEVLFFPRIDANCDQRGWLHFYSYDGELKFERYAPIIGRFPGDSAGVLYDIGWFDIHKVGGKPIIASVATQELPSRTHIRLWDGEGDSLGWYINWGHCAICEAVDLDSDGIEELLFLCINNGMKGTVLLALRVDTVAGFSPFRGCENNDFEWYTPGSQLGYVLFPMTDIGRAPNELPQGYNNPGTNGIQISEDGLIKVYICESAAEQSNRAIIYFLNHDLRINRVVMNDHLKTRREYLVDVGKLPPIDDWAAYYADMRDSVKYWTDSGWVTEGELRAGEIRK